MVCWALCQQRVDAEITLRYNTILLEYSQYQSTSQFDSIIVFPSTHLRSDDLGESITQALGGEPVPTQLQANYGHLRLVVQD
mmetsp:Transcript_53753/g.80213  ORF Transcript_53753/g.80213 Transcript_53753/m.80213 type:complete len:82 (+) Transcript_53753:359-604(+)